MTLKLKVLKREALKVLVSKKVKEGNVDGRSQMGVMEEVLMCFCKVIHFNRAFSGEKDLDRASGGAMWNFDRASGRQIVTLIEPPAEINGFLLETHNCDRAFGSKI